VRRTAELAAGTDVSATQADLLRRDRLDSGRKTSPLAMAEDAHHIDTTPFTLDEVIDQVVALVERATAP
jgi:cytidylate kinase